MKPSEHIRNQCDQRAPDTFRCPVTTTCSLLALACFPILLAPLPGEKKIAREDHKTFVAMRKLLEAKNTWKPEIT
jgi:hypothetical protein